MNTEALQRIQTKYQRQEPILSLTAYDYPTARLLDEVGVDFLLVGDSLGMVVLGYPNTTYVTMDDMCRHVGAVKRGTQAALIVADLPAGAYNDVESTVLHARRLVEAGADAVKLEGGCDQAEKVQALTQAGIAFLGHLGMLPQKVEEEGGYRKKGKTEGDIERLLTDAKALEHAGAFGIVLESMTQKAAKRITESVNIPTIGIGAGKGKACSGQILVSHDLFGFFPWFTPSFAQPRADVAGEIQRSTREWLEACRQDWDAT